MASFPRVVAFYTCGTPYEREVEKLRRSVETLGLEHSIVGVADLGSWEANTHYKARFIRDMRSAHRGEPLLYVDADAIVRLPPVWLRDAEADVAVRFQDFPYRKDECLSGTIYFGDGAIVDELIERWIALNDAAPAQRGRPTTYEQENLRRAIQTFGEALRVANLPPEYCFIFDTMRRIYPDARPVVEHFQASRRFARRVSASRRRRRR